MKKEKKISNIRKNNKKLLIGDLKTKKKKIKNKKIRKSKKSKRLVKKKKEHYKSKIKEKF